MYSGVIVSALWLSLAGTLVVALADAWLSRSILIYLDAVEANVQKIVEALRSGSTQIDFTGINLKRDLRQNQARMFKSLGWFAMASGFGLQIAVAWLTRHSV
jgi:hypothetical protein